MFRGKPNVDDDSETDYDHNNLYGLIDTSSGYSDPV